MSNWNDPGLFAGLPKSVALTTADKNYDEMERTVLLIHHEVKRSITRSCTHEKKIYEQPVSEYLSEFDEFEKLPDCM